MQPGDISKPIRNPNSVIFLKLTDKKSSQINELDKDKIKRLIKQKNELFSLYSNSHLSKLKNNALIEYK